MADPIASLTTAVLQSQPVRAMSWKKTSVLIVVALLALTTLTLHHVKRDTFPENDGLLRSLQKLHAGNVQKLDAVLDDPSVLNVHVVPHTHDDVGWLKTVEQYFYGQNMTIQKACVQDILDTVVEALLDNPKRTFTYVEMKFFSMWWYQQTDVVKDSVRFLVANKQLSFANGGWCMHDEAATHYMGMIDQTTLGHSFLKEELGYVPTVGWQLDPFGHSASQVSLLSARVGFDALYFGRIDYQDLDIRHKTQECEGLWTSSKSSEWDDAVFWGLTGSYSGNYGNPDGFCYDVLCPQVPRLVDMNRTDLLKRIHLFVDELKQQSDRTKGNHMMLTMGEDFNYRRAGSNFANVDLLVSSVSLFQRWNLINVSSVMGPRFSRINMFYSSPEYYTQMKYEEGKQRAAKTGPFSPAPLESINWTTKTDDFFPYSECPHCMWTGYFTSRAAFKRLERVGSSFLLAARQIEAFPEKVTVASSLCNCESGCDCNQPLYELEDALGVAQHHDAVSGTAKQHVSNDYSKRVQKGINKAAMYVGKKLKKILLKDSNSTALDNLSYCQLINETICLGSQEATKEPGFDIYVVVYNSLGSSNKSQILRLPVSVDGAFEVTKLGKHAVESSVHSATRVPFAESSVSPASANYILAFDTGPIPPVGAAVFKIRKKNWHAETHSGETKYSHQSQPLESIRRLSETVEVRDSAADVVASNGMLAAQFDRVTGELKMVSTDDVSVNVSQTWGYYTSFDDTMDNATDKAPRGLQNSGAYIFRPSKPDMKPLNIPYTQGAKFVNTSLGLEVQVHFEVPWIKQVTRVFNGLPYVEIEYTVGPIPIDDKRGKEIVTRFVTPIQSNGTFYTDSNGREFQKRQRNYRPSWPLEVFEPVAGNFYPVNAAMYIEDESASLSLLVDRSQGGASIVDGSIEMMAHRRVLRDDSRGVGEPLNETDGDVTPYPPFGKHERWGQGLVIRGTYRIMVGKGMGGASLARSEMDDAFSPPLVFVASTPSSKDDVPFARTSFSALDAALPSNVMLITFKKLHGNNTNEYLIRLGHQYGLEEDPDLSKEVILDLATLFTGLKVASATEMTLSANQAYNDWVNSRLEWTGTNPPPMSTVSDTNTTVVLQPMEVRTFVVQLVSKS